MRSPLIVPIGLRRKALAFNRAHRAKKKGIGPLIVPIGLRRKALALNRA